MPVPAPEQIDQYESVTAQFASAIEGLGEEQLRHAPAPGEWSIHEVLVHLPDSEIFAYERVRRILAEEQPTLDAFSEEIWAARLDYPAQNVRIALDVFRALRRSNAALFRMLTAEQWERTGNHTERGSMSLYDVFMIFLRHGQAHLEQVEQAKRSL